MLRGAKHGGAPLLAMQGTRRKYPYSVSVAVNASMSENIYCSTVIGVYQYAAIQRSPVCVSIYSYNIANT